MAHFTIHMTGDAKSVTAALRGRWMGSYAPAPCPICQPETRGDQNALTLADSPDGRLLPAPPRE